MANATYFVQECPTCGRNLQVRVEYLGKRVVCQHCSSRFRATQDSSASQSEAASESTLMQRAEELLQTAEASGIGIRGRDRQHRAAI
ncbi:MAG: response regulator [Planctomycetota bacterium]